MNPFKYFSRSETVAADLPDWVRNDLQRYFMSGYLEAAFAPGAAHRRLLQLLGELHAGDPRPGSHWEQKYPHTKDLRPSAGEYDDSVLDVLIESDVPGLLRRATGLSLTLAHVQIRLVLPGNSYMDWHRDTHYYDGALTGAIPPMHKVIYYPALGAAAPQLKVAPGSHRRVMPDQKRDLQQVAESGIRTIASSDERFLLFETSLLHAVVPETNARGSLRVIYAFGQQSQLEPFENSRAVQRRYAALLERAEVDRR